MSPSELMEHFVKVGLPLQHTEVVSEATNIACLRNGCT